MELFTRKFTAVVYSNGVSHGVIPVTLNANPADPLAVEMRAYIPAEVIWLFSVELIREAYNRETYEIGEGDVLTRVHGGEFILCLESPEGAATLVFDALEVLDFLMESENHIPTQRQDELVAEEIDRFLSSLTEE